MKKYNKSESLAKATKDLCLKHPFYGLYLMMMNKEWSDKVPTAGVSKKGINYQLKINDKFWETLTPEWRLGITQHECLHICFFHLETHDRYKDKQIANQAMDMEINQYIETAWLPARDMSKDDFDAKYDPIVEQLVEDLKAEKITGEEYDQEISKIPPRGIYIEDYPELNLNKKAGSKYYYDKLIEAKEEKKESKGRGEDSKEGAPGNKNGTSGCKTMDQKLEQMERGEATACDHDWKEFENLTESEKKLMRSQVDFHLKEAAKQITKSRGTIPGELKDYIDNIDVVDPPKFDWRGYLRNFIGGSTKTFTKKTRRKESKRFVSSPGQKILTKRSILLGIDTSGSVSKSIKSPHLKKHKFNRK